MDFYNSFIICVYTVFTLNVGRILLADNSGIDCILACVSDPRNSVYQREKCAYPLLLVLCIYSELAVWDMS
jgi:hypothetical protein